MQQKHNPSTQNLQGTPEKTPILLLHPRDGGRGHDFSRQLAIPYCWSLGKGVLSLGRVLGIAVALFQQETIRTGILILEIFVV